MLPGKPEVLPGKPARRRNRVSITLHFTPGVDDDLIAMLEQIPTGRRMSVVKKALRGILGGNPALVDESPSMTEINGKLDWLQNALTDLPGYLERVIGQVARSGPSEPQAVETVAPDVLAERAAKLKQRKW